MATNPYAAYGMRNQQQSGYSNVPQGGNPRQTEAWALTEAARRMREAADREPFDEEELLTAVRLNWRLWTIFQTELASPDCDLPAEVRHNMLQLSNFVDKRSVDVVGDPKPHKIAILVTINREIAGGLFTTPPEQAETTDAPAPVMALNTSI